MPSACSVELHRTRRRPRTLPRALGGRIGRVPRFAREQGSHVEVITPNADSRATMDTNQMDPATRIPAACAGRAQGEQEATRLAFI